MAVSDKVDLAHEPDFVLGRLTVSPSRRELVRDDGEREIIEHRVMQVLIALTRAEGRIVTRDELTMSCWNGRVVGDDAIHRVLSRLRKVANGIGAGSIEIETITKIGYRLTSNDRQAAEDGGPSIRATLAVANGSPAVSPTRRNLLIGGVVAGALAAAGGGAILYRRVTSPSLPPEIPGMIEQALHLSTQNTREGQNQGLGIYRRVVELAPDYADGWGMLGISYGIISHYRERAEGKTMRARAEAAARRALELDPGNSYGEVALGVALPFIGHWMERERHLLRALASDPNNDQALQLCAVAFQFVGRNKEAVPLYQRLGEKPLTPAHYNNYIRALWSANRMEEADRAMADAATLYPTQGTIWITRFHILMFGGNPGAAAALMEDEKGRPSDIDGVTVPHWIAQARAIESRDPVQVESVKAAQMVRARVSAYGAENAIRVLNALGQVDEAFAVADALYFSRGFKVPDFPTPGSASSTDQRQTRMLFEPVARPMRADRRFERLVEALGLDRYWREAGVQPDYRRG